MNKTININLAGIVFHIDEEAFNKLQTYLDAVKRSLKGTEGREEIIADIEARIAELFSERIKEKEVVTIEDVDHIIAKLGQPDDYKVDDSIFEEEATGSKKSSKTKRLYRDTDDKIIGGVCSGIGHYLGIDPLWVRLLFIVLFFGGFPIIAYLILWIIVPEAATTAQKLEMKGEAANLSNIERKVKEGFENVKKKVDDLDLDETGKKVKESGSTFFGMISSIIYSFFSFLGKLITGIFSFAGKLIGVILILVSFGVIISIFISFITFSFIDVNFGSDIAPIFLTNSFIDFPVWLSSLLLILAIGIPFFMLMYLGLKILVKNIKPMSGVVKLSLLGAWLLSIFALIFISIDQVANESIKVSENPKIEQLQAQDTLYVQMKSSKHYDRVDPLFNIDHMSMSYDQDGEQILFSRHIRFDIHNSNGANPSVEISRAAKGRNYKKALERAQKISYDYELTYNTLYLNDYFTAPKDSKMRSQEIEVDLYIPENTVIKLNQNTANYISHRVDNNMDFYRKDMADHLWKMSANNQLECLDCEQ
jgi:phage shock protein PspC (stress-responsive transcriptional regulator)